MEKKALPMMSFVESIATCFKKYVTFKGRARRSESSGNLPSVRSLSRRLSTLCSTRRSMRPC